MVVQPSFLVSALELPKETAKKVFKALRNIVENPTSASLHLEKLKGRASHLWSARVDDDFRIIFLFSESNTPIVLFVGKHDAAYGFADRSLRSPKASKRRIQAPLLTPSYSETPLTNEMSPSRIARQELAVRKEENESEAEVEMTERSMELKRQIVTAVDDIEGLVTTRKYLPLAFFLMESKTDRRELSFATVERLVSLPDSARKYRAWWANESKGRHVQARAWMGVGWRVQSLDLERSTVLFVRVVDRDLSS